MSRALLALLLFALALPGSALARAGDLDPSFGGDGSSTLSGRAGDVAANAVARQPDGRVLAAGGDGLGFVVARLTPSGRLDRRFGSSGNVSVRWGGATATAEGVGLLRDERIVVAGTLQDATGVHRFAVARLLPAGDLDPNFGTDGVTVVGPEGAELEAMELMRDGQAVLAGSITRGPRSSVVVVRLNPDGTPDASFDGDGVFESDPIVLAGRARDVLVGADGAVTLAVSVEAARKARGTFTAARLTPAGALDPAFDGDGVARVSTTRRPLRGGGAAAIAAGPGGRVVLAGTVRGAKVRDDATLVRLLADGRLDPRFGRSGVARPVAPGGRSVRVAALAGDRRGRLVLGGASRTDAAVLRLRANGRRDGAFGRSGFLLGRLGKVPRGGTLASQVNALEIQPDAKIVTAGSVSGDDLVAEGAAGTLYLAIARLRG